MNSQVALSLSSPFPDECGWFEAAEREREWHLCQAAHFFSRSEENISDAFLGILHMVTAIPYHIPYLDCLLYAITYIALSVVDPQCMMKVYERAFQENNEAGMALLKIRGAALVVPPPKPTTYIRDDIHQRMDQVFKQRFKSNPLLIGPQGVGKTTIAETYPKEVTIIDHIDELSEGALKQMLATRGPLIGCCRAKGKHEVLLERYFTDIEVAEPDEGVCLDILKGVFPEAHEGHLQEAITLSTDGALPGKAIDFYDQAPDKTKLQDFAHQRSGMPTFTEEKLGSVEDFLSQRVIGQDHVIEEVADTLRNFAKGMGAAKALHFVGLTGTGKTELSRVMAEWLYGSKENVLKINMGRYKDSHQSSELFGAAPGLIGYDKGGIITERAKKGPFLLLLDDVHLGSQEILEKIIQGLCDDKKLLDPLTQKHLDMRNILVVMTSNIGAREIKGLANSGNFLFSTSMNLENLQETAEKAVRDFYDRDELRNRFISIPFFPTQEEHLMEITEKLLAEEEKRFPFTITWTDKFKRMCARKGKNLEKGVRGIQEYLEGEVRGTINKFSPKSPLTVDWNYRLILSWE